MPTLKEQLHHLCGTYITNRETEIKKLIADAQEASANETKSSAGDKYETTRELMQQEINLNLTRLAELHKLKATWEHTDPAQAGPIAAPGSVACTGSGNFYLCISAGQLQVNGEVYYAVSTASPIGSKLAGRKAGDSFVLNGKTFVINKVI